MTDTTATDAEGLSAWQFLTQRADEFRALGPRIAELMRRASHASAAARQAGDIERADEARAATVRLGELFQLHESTVQQLNRWGLMGPSLGALPFAGIAAVGAVIVAAGTVAFILARFGAESRIVSLIERGQLTPGEAERLLAQTEGATFSSPMGSVTTLLALGILGWVVVRGVR